MAPGFPVVDLGRPGESNAEPVCALRAKLRKVAVDRRVAKCGLFGLGIPEVVIQDAPGGRNAWWGKVQHCQRQWGCPVCAGRKAATRADELDRLMMADRDGRWQMVTLTLRHHGGESLREVLGRLVRAWRAVRAHRTVRTIMKQRVSASCRALEVTFGSNGWHPHIHILWRTSEWTATERAELEALWCSAAGAELGVGVRWSTPIYSWQPERARYLARLGCEVSGVGKAARAGHLTPWQVANYAAEAKRAAVCDARWLFRWREFQESMKGRRVLELDERAKAMVPPKPERVHEERRVSVLGEVYEAIARRHWWLPLAVLEAAQGGTIDEAAKAVENAIEDLIQDELHAPSLRKARAPPDTTTPVNVFGLSGWSGPAPGRIPACC